PPAVFVHLDPQYRERFVLGYQQDAKFKRHWETADTPSDSWHPGQRYFKDEDGLLFFRDADFVPRLCVPESERNFVLDESHNSPYETGHAG
ncbi:hypothetical protein PENSPDRAFT_550823, partial [Peniophora sp. CONT]